MHKYFILFFSLLFIFSCTNKRQENKSANNSSAAKQDTLVPLQETVIADLPDSSQPKTVLLENMPKPLTIPVPKTRGGSYSAIAWNGELQKINLEPPVTNSLPVLKNEKGEIIKDKDGNPFIMGNGGISHFTTYSTDNGLTLDMITTSCLDHLGNLWFGTGGGGVSRYDGKSFTNFTTANGLANNNVNSITEDKTGNLWFGTGGGGISRYDGKMFTNFTTAHGLVNNIVQCITKDKTGNLWFGTLAGASCYDGKSFTNFTTANGLANNNVNSITEDKTGNLWFGTGGGGVSRYDGKTFTNFTTAHGLANNTVQCITEDRSGNLWFGTQGGGVSRYDVKSMPAGEVGFTNYTSAQGLSYNDITCITDDKTGNLWFGTLGGGASRYDGNAFTNFTTAQGLANSIVWSITEDKMGNLWFGTLGGGVSRYDGKTFTNYTTAQGLAYNNVYSITEDKSGNLWFGTLGGGVSRYNGKTFTSYTTAQGLPANAVRSMTEDKAGNLWLGTSGGVSRYDGKSFTNFTTAQGLANNIVNCITEDKMGNLWFGTLGGGASRYDGKSFTNFTTVQGLAHNIIWNIIIDKTGNLWFCTENGLSFLSMETLMKLQKKNTTTESGKKISGNIFKNFTKADGLPDNFSADLLEVKDGYFLVGINFGICELIGSPSGGFKVGLTYNSATGYPVKDLNTSRSMFMDSKGIIWIATGAEKTGLVRFDISALNKKNNKPPDVFIQGVKINNENICWFDLDSTKYASQSTLTNKDNTTTTPNITEEVTTTGRELSDAERGAMRQKFGDIQFDSIAKFYPVPANLVLPHAHNNISFEFAAIEPAKPNLVRYQYMLEGYDDDWNPVTNKTTASFGNIYEGTYTFKLKASSPEGVWSEPISYTFKVLPPWWRTWWAYLLYAITIIGIVVFIFRWRTASLRRDKEILEHKVKVRTAQVVAEKKKSDDLLLNILPAEVAEELKAKGSADAKQFDEVTVMFTDFKGFTQISEKLSPAELVAEIDTCFKAFDHIITRYNIEKIKTIGDSYMCAGGLPVANKTNATDVVSAAVEIQQFMQQHLQQRKKEGKEPFEIRIGIHTGPVVAGIVGVKKFAYDIWGDTVNIASRMESSGEAGKVNISGATHELVKDKFSCVHRGKIQAKNKGDVDMYFVESVS